MNDKEMNIAILEGLKQIANEIFSNEINIASGTYTAAELAKGKSSKGDDIEINYIQTNNESILMHSVCVGSFKCEFERKNIFNLIWKFEQLSGTKQKDKARFVRIEAGKVDLSFNVEITKDMYTLCKCVRDYEESPIMSCIFIDYKKGYIVASNGKHLKACKVDISNIEGETETDVLINPKDLKQLSGVCKVSVSGDGVTILDGSGRSYSLNTSYYKYPNWSSVIPEVSSSNYIKLNEVKEILFFLKRKEGNFSIRAEKGNIVTIDFANSESGISSQIKVSTEKEIPFSFSVMFNAKSFHAISKKWNGGLFLDANYKAVVLVDKDESLCFTMPSGIGKGGSCRVDFEFDRSDMVSLFEFCIKEDAESKDKEKAQIITAKEPESNPTPRSEQKDICIECKPEDVPDYWDYLNSVTISEASTSAPICIDTPTVQAPELLPPVLIPERPLNVPLFERLRLISFASWHYLITGKGVYYLIA